MDTFVWNIFPDTHLSKEQRKYLCDIIAQQTTQILVKIENAEHGKINIADAQEAIDGIKHSKRDEAHFITASSLFYFYTLLYPLYGRRIVLTYLHLAHILPYLQQRNIFHIL